MLRLRFTALGVSPALGAKAAAEASSDRPLGGMGVAHLVEPLVSYGLVVLFVSLLFSAGVSGVSDFNWVYFLDHDDSYQAEQLLLNSGQDSFGRKAAYGSELFLLAPVQRIVEVAGDDALIAYRLLKVFHIFAAGAALLLLRAIVRRLGAPWFVPPLAIGLVISSAGFFTYAMHLKPDANIVLFLLAASFWTLLKFDSTEERGWLGASIALAALAAAVKWWGVFMVIPQVYLASSGGRLLGTFRPHIGWRDLTLAGAAAFGILAAVAISQARITVDAYPHTATKGTILAIVVVALLIVGFVVSAGAGWMLLRRADPDRAGDLPVAARASRLAYRVLSIGGLFTVVYLALVGVFLLSDQLQPSITYFSKYDQASGGAGLWSAIGGAGSNVAGWASSTYRFGALPPLLLPLLAVSAFVMVRAQVSDRHLRGSRALALFLLALVAFLFVLVTKKNGATQAMILPIVVVLALAPVTAWAMGLTPRSRHLALAVVAALALSQIGWQSWRTSEVYSGYRSAIQAIETINEDLERSLRESGRPGEAPTVLIREREIPVHSGTDGVVHLSAEDYRQEVDLMARSCAERSSGGETASSGGGDTFLVLVKGSLGRSEPQIDYLLAEGCIERISTIEGGSYRRGGSFRYAIDVYGVTG